MTAHPKVDPRTGEMVFFGTSPFPPYLRVHSADADGTLTWSTEVDLPGVGDDARLRRSPRPGSSIFDLPAVFDVEALITGGTGIYWAPERGARIGVLDRGAPGSTTTWIEVDPFWVFHFLNAHDDGDAIEVVGLPVAAAQHQLRRRRGRTRRAARCSTAGASTRSPARSPTSSSTTGPPTSPASTTPGPGCPTATATPATARGFDRGRAAVRRRHQARPRGRHHRHPPVRRRTWSAARRCSRPTPTAPPRTAAGCSTSSTTSAPTQSSVVVLDAATLEEAARVHLPRRVPFGFHGSFLP